MRWFSSDHHFSHKNILVFEPTARLFASLDEMNAEIVRRHNAVVSPDDEVFMLGDLTFGDFQAGLALLAQMNGRKHFMYGNHDRNFPREKAGRIAKAIPMYQEVFETILPGQMEITLANGMRAMMCHFPYEGDHTGEDRFQDMRPVDQGLPLIHGHVHSLFRTLGRQFNVGVDVHDLFPVPEETIIEWAEAL